MKKAAHLLLSLCLLAGAAFAADAPARKVVQRKAPAYPDVAAKLSLHGTVRLRIWVSPAGSVRRLEYIGGHPVLAESALKAVKNWKYEPLPQESVAIVEVKF